MARIVLFDLGNVVVDWDPMRLYRSRFDTKAEAEVFCRDVCNMAWHVNHDRGVSMAQNRAPLIAAYPHHENHIVAWDTHWLDMFHGYVPGVPALIARLEEARIPLYGLSNLPAEKAGPTFDAFPMIRVLRDVVVSGAEKVVKPDRRIYEIALSRMGSPDPSQVLFVDDRRENIEAAAALGFLGHQFTGAESLEAALVATGFL